MLALLNEALHDNHLSLTKTATEKILDYLTLLQTWNRVFNLTTITEPRDKVYLHIIDSLIIQPYLQGTHLLDVGSGAGLPGLPLAIANPHQQWVLLDKNSKKTRFLTQAIAELHLSNVKVVHSRAEDFHPSSCFDTIVSRALGTLALFIQTTQHLICPGGMLLAMKGKYPAEELEHLPNHFKASQINLLAIKGMNIERHIIGLQAK